MGEVNEIRFQAVFLLRTPSRNCFKCLVEFDGVVLLGIGQTGIALPFDCAVASTLTVNIVQSNGIVLGHGAGISGQSQQRQAISGRIKGHDTGITFFALFALDTLRSLRTLRTNKGTVFQFFFQFCFHGCCFQNQRIQGIHLIFRRDFVPLGKHRILHLQQKAGTGQQFILRSVKLDFRLHAARRCAGLHCKWIKNLIPLDDAPVQDFGTIGLFRRKHCVAVFPDWIGFSPICQSDLQHSGRISFFCGYHGRCTVHAYIQCQFHAGIRHTVTSFTSCVPLPEWSADSSGLPFSGLRSVRW